MERAHPGCIVVGNINDMEGENQRLKHKTTVIWLLKPIKRIVLFRHIFFYQFLFYASIFFSHQCR
jgi:hypothetical protein